MADFDQFVAAYVDDLLRTAYLIVWDEGEAEDLVQECLLKVARRWPRIRRMEQPRAYARRILVNLVEPPASSCPGEGWLELASNSFSSCSARMEGDDGRDGCRQAVGGRRRGPAGA